MQTVHVARFIKARSMAVSGFISLTVLLPLLLLVVVVFSLESWIVSVFVGVGFRTRIDYIFANRNNQIQFKSEVHTLGSFMPVNWIALFAEETCGWFLLKKYAFNGRTILQSYLHQWHCQPTTPTRKLLSNCFAYETLLRRIFFARSASLFPK